MSQNVYWMNEESNLVLDSSYNYLLLASKSFDASKYGNLFNDVNYHLYSDIQVNPSIESIEACLKIYKAEQCDAIIAIGGGSAIDTAKVLKALSIGIYDTELVNGTFNGLDVPLVVVPTTAGTGSEATTFAVVYKDKIKHSLDNHLLLPNNVYMIPSVLNTLPDLHKKATMLDALCQCMESAWSMNATEESVRYALEGISLIVENYSNYINGDPSKNIFMLKAAHLSGKAINISKTTLPHAMSYGLTSYANIPHGISVAMVMPYAIDMLVEKGNPKLNLICEAFNCSIEGLQDCFVNIYKSLDILEFPDLKNVNIDDLMKSVNVDRLSNFPIKVDNETIKRIYVAILSN